MERTIIDRALLRVRKLLEGGEVDRAIDIVEALLPADQAHVFEELEPQERKALLPELEAEDAADILEEMDDEDVSDLVSYITPSELAYILDEMEPDKAADLLGDLDPAVRATILAQMEDADEVRPLLLYPDETAGGLMTSEYLAFPETMRVSQVLQAIRAWRPKGRKTPYLFIVDRAGRFIGVTDPFEVLQASPATTLSELARRDVATVDVSADQEVAARTLARYELEALPVVDDDGRLVGIIDADDAMEILEEETTEDIFDRAALSALGSRERTRSEVLVRGPLWRIWRVRLPFLIITLLGGLLAGMVVHRFERALETVTALAIFIPIVMDMGGNAGTQSSTIFSRALVLGHINPGKFWRHLLRETLVGLTIGAFVGVIAGVIASVWQGIPRLGWVVGTSIMVTMTIATTLGFLIPYLLFKLGVDQAAGSDPIITTIKGITGLIIYFVLAYQMMGYLFD
ncbi:MAG TPA: magnesium transporter [Chloroflexi bacterium]|nr:magnesium transporter [Chloroflexota bacterium]